MWRKKKFSWLGALILLAIFVTIGYYISGIFLYADVNISNYQEVLKDIFTHPVRNYWNEKTRACVYIASLAWMCLVMYYQYYNRNFVFGREHGSAEWADPKQVMASKGDKQGRILSQHITLSKSGKKIANNNMIVVGAPGTGKSFRIVAPNLLRNDASVVVLDVKGDLLRNYGKAMEKNGYQIKCLDVISSDFGKSHMYNPFVYVKTEVDMIRLVSNIQTSLTPQDTSKGEPFWEDGVTMYLLACFYYVWLEMEEPTLPKVQLLMNEESRILDEETGETELEKRMNTLAARSPMGNEHPAVSNYRKLKEGAPDTVRSIIIMCNSKFKFMGVAAAKRLFSEDEMNLQELGMGVNGDKTTKTALFLCVPDDDRSFDFIVGMLYTSLFQVLIECARKNGGALPIPVEVWMDEFANGSRPESFEKLITTLRSRNISVIMFLQSVSQLKQIYKNDTWEILMDACSTFLYLGGGRGAYSTHKYIADLLGTATIDKKNDGLSKGTSGSTSINFDRQSRELLTSEEISRMPDEDCIIFISGEKPIYDKKYNTQDMKEFKEAKNLGPYVPDICVKKTEGGGYVTVKSEGKIIPLSDKEVEYYKEQEKKGNKIEFIELSEKDFVQLDFGVKGFQINDELLNQVSSREKVKEAVEKEWDLSENIFEWLGKNYERITLDQREEIFLKLEQEEYRKY